MSGVAKAREISSSSISALFEGAGIIPSKYFSTIATVLETKFPKSLAKSEFIFLINISLLKDPSEPKGISLNR